MITIHEAARAGDLDALKNLDQRNVSLEAVDKYGRTPLHIAIRNGKLEIVKYLDQRNVSLEAVGNYGWTPLHYGSLTNIIKAAANGKLEIVKYLDQRNVSFEVVDKYGWTPLHEADRWGQLEIVKYLDQRNVSLEAVDKDTQTPLHWGSLTNIIKAAANGELEIVKYLDQRNVSLEAVDKDGWTPLHLAAFHGRLEILKYLVCRNANLKNLNNDGLSVIDSVATQKYLEVLKWFVWNDHFVIDNCGYSGSPNDYANNKDVIRFLSDKILFGPQHFHTKFDKSLETFIDGQLCCKIEYIRGVHVLYHPVILDCSHAVCLRCIFDLTGQWYLPDSSCCINCINSIRLDELNDIKNSVYNVYIDNLSDKTFYSGSVDALQSSFKILIDNRENDTNKFNKQFEHYEVDIEIRLQSLYSKLDLLEKAIYRNINNIKLNCKNTFNCIRNQVASLEDILQLERFACLKRFKIQLNKPIKKPIQNNMGFVKSFPFGIPGYRIKNGDLRIQKKRFLKDMYEKFKEKKDEIYKYHGPKKK